MSAVELVSSGRGALTACGGNGRAEGSLLQPRPPRPSSARRPLAPAAPRLQQVRDRLAPHPPVGVELEAEGGGVLWPEDVRSSLWVGKRGGWLRRGFREGHWGLGRGVLWRRSESPQQQGPGQAALRKPRPSSPGRRLRAPREARSQAQRCPPTSQPQQQE